MYLYLPVIASLCLCFGLEDKFMEEERQNVSCKQRTSALRYLRPLTRDEDTDWLCRRIHPNKVQPSLIEDVLSQTSRTWQEPNTNLSESPNPRFYTVILRHKTIEEMRR